MHLMKKAELSDIRCEAVGNLFHAIGKMIGMGSMYFTKEELNMELPCQPPAVGEEIPPCKTVEYWSFNHSNVHWPSSKSFTQLFCFATKL